MNGELRRIRPRNEIGRAEKIEKLVVREPAPPAHDLVLHHRNVRSGPTERGRAELEKERRELAQSIRDHCAADSTAALDSTINCPHIIGRCAAIEQTKG